MPRLSEFYGIVVYMYWRDHAPPHSHAIYAGEEAQILISYGVILAGSLPRRGANLVTEWARLHHDELVANWERAQAPESLVPIEGLR